MGKLDKSKLYSLMEQREEELNKPTLELSYLPDETIISKDFGFIKWLVEKDMIDFRWMPKFEERSSGTIGIDVEGENRVLMCLAISKHPIQDLLYYLK